MNINKIDNDTIKYMSRFLTHEDASALATTCQALRQRCQHAFFQPYHLSPANMRGRFVDRSHAALAANLQHHFNSYAFQAPRVRANAWRRLESVNLNPLLRVGLRILNHHLILSSGTFASFGTYRHLYQGDYTGALGRAGGSLFLSALLSALPRLMPLTSSQVLNANLSLRVVWLVIQRPGIFDWDWAMTQVLEQSTGHYWDTWVLSAKWLDWLVLALPILSEYANMDNIIPANISVPRSLTHAAVLPLRLSTWARTGARAVRRQAHHQVERIGNLEQVRAALQGGLLAAASAESVAEFAHLDHRLSCVLTAVAGAGGARTWEHLQRRHPTATRYAQKALIGISALRALALIGLACAEPPYSSTCSFDLAAEHLQSAMPRSTLQNQAIHDCGGWTPPDDDDIPYTAWETATPLDCVSSRLTNGREIWETRQAIVQYSFPDTYMMTRGWGTRIFGFRIFGFLGGENCLISHFLHSSKPLDCFNCDIDCYPLIERSLKSYPLIYDPVARYFIRSGFPLCFPASCNVTSDEAYEVDNSPRQYHTIFPHCEKSHRVAKVAGIVSRYAIRMGIFRLLHMPEFVLLVATLRLPQLVIWSRGKIRLLTNGAKEMVQRFAHGALRLFHR